MPMNEPVPQRVGDAERDRAVEALREHHLLGRLDVAEFEERMGKALEAKTVTELDALFGDLPDPKPVVSSAAQQTPAQWKPTAPPLPLQGRSRMETPWYAQWWMILLAVGLASVSRGSLGFAVPMMAIWLWIIYPSLTRSNRVRGMRERIEAPLSSEQLGQIQWQLRNGNKIEAIKLYRNFTGTSLHQARDAVEVMQHQLGN